MVLRALQIGNVILASNVLMAPMVGLSTRAFRILAISAGCALSAAEMLNSEFLVRATRDERRRYRVWPEERPAALQIVGSRREALVASAEMIEDFGADVLDFNLGCPAKRITKGGGGVALMRDPSRAAGLLSAMKARVSIPVTAKIRAGISDDEKNAPEVARALEDAGADAIAVHARSRDRRHKGPAELDVIGAVKEAVHIPVVGNGGLEEPRDAERMLRTTGCDGVMFGRGAIGRVWVFDRTVRWLRDRTESPEPAGQERLEILAKHLDLLVREFGVRGGVVRFRKCLPHYLRGIPGAREARADLVGETDPDRIVATARRLYFAGEASVSGSSSASVAGGTSPRQAR